MIIIADDLTGAADTAACFAQAGLRTVVVFPETGFPELRDQTLASFDVISLSTNTRQLTAAEAARRVRQRCTPRRVLSL